MLRHSWSLAVLSVSGLDQFPGCRDGERGVLFGSFGLL